MMTHALVKKRQAPVVRRAGPTVGMPSGGQTVRQANVRRILRGAGAQTKLSVGAPNDVYEKEADRVADAVMQMPEPRPAVHQRPGNTLVQRNCLDRGQELQRQSINQELPEEGIQEKSAGPDSIQRQSEEEEPDEELRTKAHSRGPPKITAEVESRIRGLRMGGQPLPGSERSFMEPRFGLDLSRVRLHTGEPAADLASSLNARAFSLGRSVFFGAGQYVPGTAQGRRLLAHELTHVAQQRGGSAPGVIRRITWQPHSITGQKRTPWPSLPRVTGDLLVGATDAGRPVNIWRPDDRTTYWCHGYTFGGTRYSPPYSTWGQYVPRILVGDGWRKTYACLAGEGDILVFYGATATTTTGIPKHSGIIRSVVSSGGTVDERRSMLESKWGPGSHNTQSWHRNVFSSTRSPYGKYAAYSKVSRSGPCFNAANEIP